MCFDLSVYDIFGTLAVGAELVIVPNVHDMHHVAELVESKGVTIWNSVPAIMQMYVEVVKRHTMERDTLRLVMLSGDYIPLALPDDIKKYSRHAEVISLGGATEASIWSIYYPINAVNPTWKTIPYGMPLANQKFYVLNYDLSLTPIGVEGELYIGGRGLASSYYADPQKTESAYIMHPQLGRLYKTGDFGKFHKSGYIEFIGRKDSQVKIRGHRIELGEVENGILKADGLNSAVAVVNKSHNALTVVAYVTADMPIDVERLKDTIKQWVPSYMVPTTIVQLDSIPITSNGKVDRKYLESLDLPEIATHTENLPTTTTEKYVMELWHRHIDGLESLSVDNDFYEVGGDSVILFKIVTDLEETYHIKIDVNAMMDFETVSDMANFVDSLKGVSNYDEA
jgi:acyl-coenzyme A synthetase/AMP-(fatty) acid ligase/acyl carrier protein